MTVKLTKIISRPLRSEIDYATTESLLSLLHDMEARRDVPIFDSLKVLMQRKVDSVSFSRDRPYFYFFARLNRAKVSVSIASSDKDLEFPIPIGVLQTLTKQRTTNRFQQPR